MLKDKFRWYASVEEVEYTSCGDEIVKVELLGISDGPYSRVINTYGNKGELAKEIEDHMNNGMLDNMNVNSLYVPRGKYKPLVDYTSGYPRGIVVPLSEVSKFCHLEEFIDDVIFNDPATIVKWKDGTKTVVKVQDGETFDPMVGLAMCIAKKAMGNQGNYFEVFKKWCEPWYEEQRIQEFNEDLINANIKEILEKMSSSLDTLKINAQKSPVLGKVINCKEDKNGFTLTLDEGHHCINCKHCKRSDDIYLCTNPIIAITEIKAPQFMNCPEWEAMPEPKNEGK